MYYGECLNWRYRHGFEGSSSKRLTGADALPAGCCTQKGNVEQGGEPGTEASRLQRLTRMVPVISHSSAFIALKGRSDLKLVHRLILTSVADAHDF